MVRGSDKPIDVKDAGLAAIILRRNYELIEKRFTLGLCLNCGKDRAGSHQMICALCRPSMNPTVKIAFRQLHIVGQDKITFKTLR